VHLATQTMNEMGSLKPFSHHSASFHIKYPHRCITGKITAQILLKLLLLVIKQKKSTIFSHPLSHTYIGSFQAVFSPFTANIEDG